MGKDIPRAPSYVIVMGDADRDVLDALKDRRASVHSEVLDAPNVDEAVRSILRARPDLAIVPEDPAGNTHIELCERVKRLNPRIATVVLREDLDAIPPRHAAVDDYVPTRNNEEMMARINVLLRLRTFNARASAIRQRMVDAFEAFGVSTDLLVDGRLLPPGKVDFRVALDLDAIRDHEAAVSKLGNTSFSCFLYQPEPTCVCTPSSSGCLRGVCPVAQAIRDDAGYTVACEACRTAAWECARDAMLASQSKIQLCPGGYQIGAFPITLSFRSVRYPLMAIAVALPSGIDLEQLDRLAKATGVDGAHLRRDVARRPLPELSRVHLEALVHIEESMAEALSSRISNEYATAYNVLVEAVGRWEHDRALTRRSRQLQRANVRLREMNRLRNEFLANVSHELKTPITSIIGFVSLLLRGAAGDLSEKGEHFLNRVLANARTLHAAIDDVLDLAQLGSADVPLHPTPFEPGALIHECIESVRPALADKPIELVADLPDALPVLDTDRDRLRQILLHLLNNAIKFTTQGEIRLSAHPVAGADLPRLAISVSDTGVGLPPDALPHIFEEFRQVDGSATREHGGAGLGLSLVKKLCRLLGGHVTVESHEARGSTFVVVIPTHLHLLKQLHEELRQRVVDGDPFPDDASSPVILAVTEDDPQLILDLRRWAEPFGYRVAGACRFHDALERARALLPFAVLVDVAIPDHEVWELADELRADPRTTDTPLIVASSTDDAAIAEAAGASERLRKPINRDAFLNALDGLQDGDAARVLAIIGDDAERDRVRQALRESALSAIACANCSDASRHANTAFDAVILDPAAEGQGDLNALGCLRAGPWAAVPLVAYVRPDHPAHEREHLATAAAAIIEQSPNGPIEAIQAITRILAEQSPRTHPE